MRHPLTIFILLAGSAASSCGAGDSSTAPTSVSTVPASVSAASVSVAPTSLPEVTTPDTEGCTVPAGELNGDPTGEMAVVEIDVDGASLSGRCVGTSDGGAATVILESGMRGDRHQLDAVGDALAPRMRVCSYDRAGIGRSGAPTGAYARGLVDDLESFVDAAGAEPPLLLVVQSIGGTIVHRFAQRNPGDVMGFVSMNPVRRSRRGSSGHRPSRPPDELQQNELSFYEGGNAEGVDLRDTELIVDEPTPHVPYIVMYTEDCPGEFCDRIRPVLAEANVALAGLGSGGRYVVVDGAGHQIYFTHRDQILTEIDTMVG